MDEEFRAEKPLGLQHISLGLKIKSGTLGAKRNRGQLPPPDGWVSDKAPFWYESTMVQWAIDTGLAPATTERSWEAVVGHVGGIIPEYGLP